MRSSTKNPGGSYEQSGLSIKKQYDSLILDPMFLQEQECIVPELNEEYRITVQLRKLGTNLING